MLQITSLNFSRSNYIIFKSFIKMVKDNHIIFTDNKETVDIIAIDTDNEEGIQSWHHLNNKQILKVAFGKKNKNIDCHYYLEKPLQFDKINVLLRNISHDLITTNLPKEIKNKPPVKDKYDYYPFLSNIAKQHNKNYLLITIETKFQFILDFITNRYFVILGNKKQFFTQDIVGKVKITPLTKEVYQKATEEQTAQSLEGFLWCCSLQSINTKQLDIIPTSAKLSIEYWPDFSLCPYEKAHLRIAACLSSQSLTFNQLLKQANVSKETAKGFINAAALTQILNIDSSLFDTVKYKTKNMLTYFLAEKKKKLNVLDANTLKVVFIGSVGAGKTTSINVVSEIRTVSNEGKATDDTAKRKKTTTVGMDYGEVTLQKQLIRLYGTPGQRRFSFLWKQLSKGAAGFIILIDNSRPLPLSDLSIYLEYFENFINKIPVIIGVTRMQFEKHPNINDYRQYLKDHNKQHYPVVSVDIREKKGVLMLLNSLLSMHENTHKLTLDNI